MSADDHVSTTKGSTSKSSTDKAGTEEPGGPPPLPSDPAAIERAIEARRAHLAATVDEFVLRAKPAAIAHRSAQGAKDRLRAATRTQDGGLRVERIGAAAAALAVLALIITVWRRHAGTR